jgi:hypothetical protein
VRAWLPDANIDEQTFQWTPWMQDRLGIARQNVSWTRTATMHRSMNPRANQ